MKRISRRTTRRLRRELSQVAAHIRRHHTPKSARAENYTDTLYLYEKRGMGLTRKDMTARAALVKAQVDNMRSCEGGTFQQLIASKISPESVELARLAGLLDRQSL